MIDLKNTVLGIELGSTRIKAVLIDEDHVPIANGAFEWKDHLEDGIWSYSLEEVHHGLQACIKNLKEDLFKRNGTVLTTTGAIGISAMMHGYLVFDKYGSQLVPFRTWKNTITAEAAKELSELFCFNIPQRWSIAHLHQAYLNREEHVGEIDHMTTLAGYIHQKISGQKVLGIGDASGMFPIDSASSNYRADLVQKYEKLTGIDLRKILPEILTAGQDAGTLTEEGALFLDPEGDLQAGIPLAPPEGDAGTGMAATNSVKVHTGNVSAGTSDFAMIVVEKEVGVHREIDMVTTPAGDPVAMVHCNNCTSDLNAWVKLFQEVTELAGMKISKDELFTTLFRKALEGEKDCGGLMNINYISGEGVTDLDDGRPIFLRRPDASFHLANFMRAQLYSAISTLKIGLDILTQTEGVQIRSLCGHGGFFKTKGVGDLLLSAASGVPVKTMETAGEGGPYGMALLGAYLIRKEKGETLSDYLDNKVFANIKTTEIMAADEDISGFAAFLEDYKKALAVEKAAVKYW